MNKKNNIAIMGLVICIMIIQASPIRGANFIKNDPEDDVYLLSNSTTASTGLSLYPEIDIISIAKILYEHNPDINISIEIHSQWAPFRLNIFGEDFFEKHESPPSDGLKWYLEKSWNKEIVENLRADMPDGEESWKLEYEQLKDSIRWAKENLSSLLSK